MGRRGADPAFSNRIRQVRTAQGLSQQDLAHMAGVTRQNVNSIEANRYIPNSSVALRLAQALRCRFEELFQVEDTLAERPVELASAGTRQGQRVMLAQVRGRLIAHPLATSRAIQEGFTSADAVVTAKGRRRVARLLTTPERLERTALVMGCDPSLSVLAGHMAQRSVDARLSWLPASSRYALDAVGRGEAHIAGTHLRDPGGEGYNLSHARRALGTAGGIVVAFAAWEQGFVVAPGNPKQVRSAADLARPGVRIVNRDEGAGTRQLLDGLLERDGVPQDGVAGYGHEVGSHLEIARTVRSGTADVGIALRAAAELHGLDFVPVTQARFDLVIPRTVLDHPAVSSLLDALQTRALREELVTLPGYEVSDTGTVLADIRGAA